MSFSGLFRGRNFVRIENRWAGARPAPTYERMWYHIWLVGRVQDPPLLRMNVVPYMARRAGARPAPTYERMWYHIWLVGRVQDPPLLRMNVVPYMAGEKRSDWRGAHHARNR